MIAARIKLYPTLENATSRVYSCLIGLTITILLVPAWEALWQLKSQVKIFSDLNPVVIKSYIRELGSWSFQSVRSSISAKY